MSDAQKPTPEAASRPDVESVFKDVAATQSDKPRDQR
jgi:hypothetical protein